MAVSSQLVSIASIFIGLLYHIFVTLALLREPWDNNFLFAMNKELQQIPSGPFSFLVFVSRPHSRPALLAIFFVVVAEILGTAVPYIFKRIVDTANTIDLHGSQPLIVWV